MAVVKDGIGGVSAGQIINGNERYDIYVRFEEKYRDNQEAIADLRIQSPTGAWVRLGDIATVSFESGPPQVRRDDELNGVVMVESINQLVKNGIDTSKAAFDGAVSRLRPVLMTAITSALGLIPMLMSNGVGAEIQRPLATVIVGGLVTATLLTLFVLPVLYPWFSKTKVAQLTR